LELGWCSTALCPLSSPFRRALLQINDIALCKNAELLASASSDGTVKLWKESTDACVQTIHAASF